MFEPSWPNYSVLGEHNKPSGHLGLNPDLTNTLVWILLLPDMEVVGYLVRTTPPLYFPHSGPLYHTVSLFHIYNFIYFRSNQPLSPLPPMPQHAVNGTVKGVLGNLQCPPGFSFGLVMHPTHTPICHPGIATMINSQRPTSRPWPSTYILVLATRRSRQCLHGPRSPMQRPATRNGLNTRDAMGIILGLQPL